MDKKDFHKNVAVVGAGRWGKNLARNFYQLNALHTICDHHQSLLDQYRIIYPGVNLQIDYQAVLDDPSIHCVVIASPAFSHYRLAKLALQAGKDVYVEKPLCMNAAEAEDLIDLADKGRKILMVGHLLQYHPYVRKLQELVAKGEIGKLQYIVSNRLNLGAIRTEENALWNFAPHDVSVILSLCGNIMPLQVRCVGGAYVTQGVADTTLTTLRFAEDIRAHIYVSWLNPYKEQKLVVVGSNGMAVFDDTKQWEEKLLFYRTSIKRDKVMVPEIASAPAEKVFVPEAEPLKEECLHFLKCCRDRIHPRTDGQEGLRVLKVLEAAQASLNSDGEAMTLAENEPLKTIKKHLIESLAIPKKT